MKFANVFTTLIGIAYILLSLLRLTPIIDVNGKLMLYIGVAALLLILVDFFEFTIEGMLSNQNARLEKTFGFLRYIALFCAIVSIIVLPNLKIDIPVKRVNALSDFVTLAGLGLAITLIGLKHQRMLKRYFNDVKTDFKG